MPQSKIDMFCIWKCSVLSVTLPGSRISRPKATVSRDVQHSLGLIAITPTEAHHAREYYVMMTTSFRVDIPTKEMIIVAKNIAELLLTWNKIDRPLLNSFWPGLLTQQTKYAHNQWNSARNGLGMQNTLRNHMSHMQLRETVKKL